MLHFWVTQSDKTNSQIWLDRPKNCEAELKIFGLLKKNIIHWLCCLFVEQQWNADAQIWHITAHYHLCRRLQQMFPRDLVPLLHSPMWDHLWFFCVCVCVCVCGGGDVCVCICMISGLGFTARLHTGGGKLWCFSFFLSFDTVCPEQCVLGKININLCANFVPSRALCVRVCVCVFQCTVCILFLDQAQIQPHYLSVSLYVLIYFNSSLLAKQWVPPLFQLLCEHGSLWPPLTVWIF